MANQFWYTRNGARGGPVDSDTLKELVSSGQLLGDDLLFKPGMQNWMRVDSVPDLQPLVVKIPPLPAPSVGPPLPPAPKQHPTPATVPQAAEAFSFRGLHRQRLAILVAACAGMLATFLPWVDWYIFADAKTASGASLEDGWISLLLFVPSAVLAFRGCTNKPLVDGARLGAAIPAGFAALIGIENWPGQKIEQLRGGPGVGLFVLIAAGATLVVVAWALDDSKNGATKPPRTPPVVPPPPGFGH